jgi:hypothetical protein
MAHSWHTQSGFVTFLAPHTENASRGPIGSFETCLFTRSIGPWIIEAKGSIE